jgi:hypothetical protein
MNSRPAATDRTRPLKAEAIRQFTRRAGHVGRSTSLVLTWDIDRRLDAASGTEARLRDLGSQEVDGEEKKTWLKYLSSHLLRSIGAAGQSQVSFEKR